MKQRVVISLLIIASVCLLLCLRRDVRNYLGAYVDRKFRGKTVEDRLIEYGPAARARWMPYFKKASTDYPPAQVALIAFKDEARMLVYVSGSSNDWKYVREYRILAASGEIGPKLREGDRQVPEGVYRIESLNPNSQFHLSLRIGYPNDFDREQGTRDGRSKLGGDIMIHGSAVSIGCLAMGDEGAEDLFVLAADTGLARTTAIISPIDFRTGRTVATNNLPDWTSQLYAQIARRLRDFPEGKQ